MAPRVGFEPTTLRLTAGCSTAELSRKVTGGGKRIRTDDPLRARQVLSQLSYTPKWCRWPESNRHGFPHDFESCASANSATSAIFAVTSWWLGTESNRRHEDFQSSALPTELPSHVFYHLHRYYWSEQRDLNPRPPAPKAGALPSCAMLRYMVCPEGFEPPTS
jgi:hypothetical protein